MEHKLELEDSDGEEEGHPRKRFEPDLDLDILQNWEPTEEEYERYERLMWQEEFRKLIEMDELDEMTGVNNRPDSKMSSSSEDSSFADLEMIERMDAEREERKSSERIKHPLRLPEIIEHIMNFLDCHQDKETLENCLRVCPEWADAASKRLEKLQEDTSFDLSNKIEDMKIMEFSENLDKSVPKNCHKFNIKLPPARLPAMETALKKVGNQMKTLDVCIEIKDKDYPNPQIDHFGDYLEQYCPRLEKLKLWLYSSDHYPDSIFSHDSLHILPVRHIETEDFTDNPRTHIFEELIEASPLLDSLTFQHESTELIVRMLNIVVRQGRLRQLTSLECYHFDLNDAFIAFALKHHWNLRNLKVAFKSEVSTFSIRAMLNHMRESLESLEILYKGPEHDPLLVCEDNWVIPLSMRKLKHLTVAPNIFSNACRFLVNALQLPSLKTLKVTSSVSWCEGFFEIMWRRNRLKRKELVLDTVEIPCSCLDASIFLQYPNPFRNVNELVLESPSVKVLQAIFLAQPNLERLKIYELYSLTEYTWDDITTGCFNDLRGRPLIWDEVLTGKKKPEYTIMYKMAADPLMDAVPSIRHLKNLKFLLLDFKNSVLRVSDFFIYHGLMHMTQLQHVDINRHDFTDEGIKDLREHLASFCHLELGTEWEAEDMRG